jgi:hypothetical protein
MWFSCSQLPFAFGIMLFMIKAIRALNDNLAPMFYNATNGGLVPYFWVGFAVSAFSLICCFLIMSIHESVIDTEETQSDEAHDPESNLKQDPVKKQSLNVLVVLRSLPK